MFKVKKYKYIYISQFALVEFWLLLYFTQGAKGDKISQYTF